MKKKITVFLMAIMVLAVGAGCSSGSGGTAQETQATTAAAQVPTTAQNVIGDAKAKEIALSKVQGASEADIKKFNLDQDDGRQEYEIEIIYNEMEYDCEIDAVSGEILSWSEESIYAD